MSNIDNLSVNAIRVLSADAVQKANSGHPGLPLGAAAIGYELWANHMTQRIPAGKIETDSYFQADMALLFFTHCSIFLDMDLLLTT